MKDVKFTCRSRAAIFTCKTVPLPELLRNCSSHVVHPIFFQTGSYIPAASPFINLTLLQNEQFQSNFIDQLSVILFQFNQTEKSCLKRKLFIIIVRIKIVAYRSIHFINDENDVLLGRKRVCIIIPPKINVQMSYI